MSDFHDMEPMLQDFLAEAGELLCDVDNKLIALETSPHDARLLDDIFRGFHTIKGGAGFLNATALVELCHLTESLFDRLRTRSLALDASVLDAILAATATVREMFGVLAREQQPAAADPALLDRLEAILRAEIGTPQSRGTAAVPRSEPSGAEPDWAQL